MIEFQNITFSYRDKSEPVFDDFCLRLEQNKVYGLLGENGTGKSTLLYLLMGLLRPSEGHITVDGTDVSRRKRTTLQQMYIVPEEFELPTMRFIDYVKAYRPFYPAFSEDILRRCMEEFHLPLDARLNQLSMGDKKKALMSFALATNVRYLLMDEPTKRRTAPSSSPPTNCTTWIRCLTTCSSCNAHIFCSMRRSQHSARSTPSTFVPTMPSPTRCSTQSAPHKATPPSPSASPTTRKRPSTSNCCSMP